MFRKVFRRFSSSAPQEEGSLKYLTLMAVGPLCFIISLLIEDSKMTKNRLNDLLAEEQKKKTQKSLSGLEEDPLRVYSRFSKEFLQGSMETLRDLSIRAEINPADFNVFYKTINKLPDDSLYKEAQKVCTDSESSKECRALVNMAKILNNL